MRILKKLFEPEEALIALGLDWRFRSTDEVRASLAFKGTAANGDLESILRRMAAKGSILYRTSAGSWALMPFIVGMYELQLARLTKELFQDTSEFLYKGYGFEMLTTGEHQTRVIPIGAAIRPEHRIASYDEFREIIRAADGHIAVLDCVCRRGADLVGRPCKATDRRELCIVFRDFADTTAREGWGRSITTAQALEIAAENERDGLVMRPSNEKEPQFLCGCCGDCCGLLGIVKAMKRPADFVASNFRASVCAEICTGCGACARKCPMQAIRMIALAPAKKTTPKGGGAKARKLASVLPGRCIGCGVCVAACSVTSVALERRASVHEPPATTEALLERLYANKPPFWKKVVIGLKGLAGIPQGRRK